MIEKIKKVEDLKKLTIEDKKILADEIRQYLLEVISKNGGHLASNLGVVELTIALESVLDMEHDKIIWDVGHQSYVHKILTGRYEELKNIRQMGHIAGFPKTSESKYDVFNTGHSSTSISAALGIATANKLNGDNSKVVAVIGDGALTGGMAYEGLMNAGTAKTNLLVILNDNEMSISKNIGGINKLLSKFRTKKRYVLTNTKIKNLTKKIPYIGNKIVGVCHHIKWSIKQLVIPKMFFEDIGFKYLGVVDGHNIYELEEMIKLANTIEGPVLLHVNTKKGKGYEIAEKNPDKYHSTSPFDIKTGKPKSTKEKDYSAIFGDKLVNLAKDNEKIVAVTAAMTDGTGLRKFANEFPKRFIDTTIAEQHALTLCAGLASNSYIPVVNIYSSFYQRAYDQIVHDIAIQNLPVVMCIDRSGIVGQDGETHQGLLDFSMLSSVPNLTVTAPATYSELEDLLEFAVSFKKPISIRFPRGSQNKLASTIINTDFEKQEIEAGKCQILKFNPKGKTKLLIIAIGDKVQDSVLVAKFLEQFNIYTTVVNSRFLKPFDEKNITNLIQKNDNILTVENAYLKNGLASCVLELIAKNKFIKNIETIGYPDCFIEHGKPNEIERKYKTDILGILEKAYNLLEIKDKCPLQEELNIFLDNLQTKY